MSFHENVTNSQCEDVLESMMLSKYGFGFKLTSFTTVLGWIGMIFSIITCVGALVLIAGIIDMSWICPYVPLYCGLLTIFGALTLLGSPVWFYLSFQLRRQSKEKDLKMLTKTLKIVCYIQAALSILVSGPLLVFPVLEIIGIARKRTKLLKIYIIYTIVIFFLVTSYIVGDAFYVLTFGPAAFRLPLSWSLNIVVVTMILFLFFTTILQLVCNPCQYNNVYIYVMFNIVALGAVSYYIYRLWYFIRGYGSITSYGILGCLTPLIYSFFIYFYHNGFIICLQTIMDYNENKMRRSRQ